MNQWVKDDIGQRQVLNGRIPVFHRQRTGDRGRASPMAVFVFKDLKYVSSTLIIEGGERSVIENEEICLCKRGYELGILPIAFGNGEFFEESREMQVEDCVAVTASLVAQGTCLSVPPIDCGGETAGEV